VYAARDTDPRIQVLAYNKDTHIVRENPRANWEAPFTYLLFGNHGALLIDCTGLDLAIGMPCAGLSAPMVILRE
jgi:hypothetical protein